MDAGEQSSPSLSERGRVSRGWVKVGREEVETLPFWPGNTKQVFSKMDAWLDLRVLLARGKPNGKLKENQAEMTCRLLSKRWRWSKDKVHRFLKLLEKANMMRFESRSQSRDGMSVITILKPFKSETVSATVRETVNLLDQKSLLDTSETVRETVCATSLEKDREVISKPVGGNAKREAAKRIREYCLEHGHWRPFQSGKTKEKATKNIMGWLGRSGYTEEQLIG